MEHRFDRLEKKIDRLQNDVHKVVVLHGEKLTRLETTQKGFFTILSGLWVMTASWLIHKLGLR